jgi:hypothetical protein
MDTLDEMKCKWVRKPKEVNPYDTNNMSRIIRQRTQKHLRESMKYFWASFTLQLVVYGLYTHVILKNLHDPSIVAYGLAGITIFVPFTYMLMRKFKQMAVLKPAANEATSVRQYIVGQRTILHDFFRFKVRYEWLLIPLSTFFGTWLVFKIYVPGGPVASPNGVWITAAITLLSCYVAIRNENRKGFRTPLAQLDKLLKEFSDDHNEASANNSADA